MSRDTSDAPIPLKHGFKNQVAGLFKTNLV